MEYLPIAALPAADPASLARRWTAFVWQLATMLQSIVEDLEGNPDPRLRSLAKWFFAEALVRADFLLAGAPPMDEMHEGPFAVQHGLSALARLSGPGLVEALDLFAHPDEERAEPVLEFWSGLVEAFPGEMLVTIGPEGTMAALRALKSWEKLYRRLGVPTGLLGKFLENAS